MGHHNSNIAKAGTRSIEYPQLTVKQTTAAELEAALETALGDAVDEVTADGDVADAHTEIMSLMGLMFPIQIAASLHKNGKC
jgi:hypothetical protein